MYYDKIILLVIILLWSKLPYDVFKNVYYFFIRIIVLTTSLLDKLWYDLIVYLNLRSYWESVRIN